MAGAPVVVCIIFHSCRLRMKLNPWFISCPPGTAPFNLLALGHNPTRFTAECPLPRRYEKKWPQQGENRSWHGGLCRPSQGPRCCSAKNRGFIGRHLWANSQARPPSGKTKPKLSAPVLTYLCRGHGCLKGALKTSSKKRTGCVRSTHAYAQAETREAPCNSRSMILSRNQFRHRQPLCTPITHGEFKLSKSKVFTAHQTSLDTAVYPIVATTYI